MVTSWLTATLCSHGQRVGLRKGLEADFHNTRPDAEWEICSNTAWPAHCHSTKWVLGWMYSRLNSEERREIFREAENSVGFASSAHYLVGSSSGWTNGHFPGFHWARLGLRSGFVSTQMSAGLWLSPAHRQQLQLWRQWLLFLSWNSA